MIDYVAIIGIASVISYNTQLVLVSTALLGVASGLVGSFLLLRKRSLMGDALSHATLPGIALAFIIMVALGGSGKSLPGLLGGALVFGVIGYVSVLLIRGLTRIKDDAAMGLVLSTFFGLGVVLLDIAQTLPGASAAGLEGFIYGKTASIIWSDFVLLCGVTLTAGVASVVLFKEFKLLCFDAAFAASQGFPVRLLDVLLLGLVAVVTVAGLQSVGLVLIIAFLITPAAAARFWTDRFAVMLAIAALIGGLSGGIGSLISAQLPNLPAGAVIVLVAAGLFGASLLVGPARGVIWQQLRQARLRRKVARQHLLRAAYEFLEARASSPSGAAANPAAANTAGTVAVQPAPVPLATIFARRSWSARGFKRGLRSAEKAGLLTVDDAETFRLTPAGLREAASVTRNHRLWEIYLIEHADVATTHVDRDADAVEHVLGTAMVRKLEQHLWQSRQGIAPTLASPHPLDRSE